MKFIVLLFLFMCAEIYAGTCSSISRTNNSANAVLTSVKYNADHNTAYNFLNAYDGGCITSSTVEQDALSATDFEVPLNGIKKGCKVTKSDDSTLTTGICYFSVDNSWVVTATSSLISFGCGGCSAEVASTTYYLYAKPSSTLTTLDLLISTTVPNGLGDDTSGNLAIARFYNDGSGDVDGTSIDQWGIYDFEPNNTDAVSYVPNFVGMGTVSAIDFHWHREGQNLLVEGIFTAGTTTGVNATISIPDGLEMDDTALHGATTTNGQLIGHAAKAVQSAGGNDMSVLYNGNSKLVGMSLFDNGGVNPQVTQAGNAILSGTNVVSIRFKVPIKGWSN
jgi:hypothetical protein